MHHLIRITIASLVSSIIGWLSITTANLLYSLVANQPPAATGTFTTFNWILATVISALTFVYAYIKITNWIEG